MFDQPKHPHAHHWLWFFGAMAWALAEGQWCPAPVHSVANQPMVATKVGSVPRTANPTCRLGSVAATVPTRKSEIASADTTISMLCWWGDLLLWIRVWAYRLFFQCECTERTCFLQYVVAHIWTWRYLKILEEHVSLRRGSASASSGSFSSISTCSQACSTWCSFHHLIWMVT